MLMVKLRRTLILLALLGLPTTVLAQASTRVSNAPETRCQRVADNVAKRRVTYALSLAHLRSVLDDVHLRVDGVAGRADARGYNVSRLAADQTKLDQKASTIEHDYKSLIDSLSGVQTTCAAPEAITASLAALHALRSDVAGTQEWITLTLRDDITQLKTQVKK